MKKSKKKRPTLNTTSRIGIINRGEAAVRFIRALKEFNTLYNEKLTSIAFYLDIEQESPFVKKADETYSFTHITGYAKNQRHPYLNRELMMKALISTHCQALWVGWGFLAEDAVFTAMVEDAGLVFLGPSSKSMALLGDKIAAKELAERSQVPILPWSKGPVKDIKEAQKVARQIGYPLILSKQPMQEADEASVLYKKQKN